MHVTIILFANRYVQDRHVVVVESRPSAVIRIQHGDSTSDNYFRIPKALFAHTYGRQAELAIGETLYVLAWRSFDPNLVVAHSARQPLERPNSIATGHVRGLPERGEG